MAFFIRGALVEYGNDFLGPIPNIVVFQFNPEQISRTINIPGNNSRSNTPENARQTESNTASAPPIENFTITAHFTAMNDLGGGGVLSAIPREFGIGPQLAALEKMANTTAGFLSQALGAVPDAVGDALSNANNKATRKIPREGLPKILFIWGPSRVLPVEFNSMSIIEQQYDPFLNPVQAQVDIGLEVSTIGNSTDNPIGKGALNITNTKKEEMALLNLVKPVELTVETVLSVIPF